MELSDPPAINNNEQDQQDTTLVISWQAMFQQLKDWQELGHKKGFPPRIARWMAAQRRQYRIYGIGKKTPVGIIKHRVKKLNSLGFNWESPTTTEDGFSEKKRHKKKSKIKHNLLASGTKKSKNKSEITQENNYLARSSDFYSPDEEEKARNRQMRQSQSSRGRIRVPSRRMQESYDANEEIEMANEYTNRTDDDLSASGTSGDGSQDVGSANKSRVTFPGVLLDLVNETNETNPEIIEWLPCGTAFRINDENALGEVLEKYFRHNKASSFIRQLNLYGFSKQIHGECTGAFKHPLFTRNSTKDQVNVQIDRGGMKVVRKTEWPSTTRSGRKTKTGLNSSTSAPSKSAPNQRVVGRPSTTEMENRYIKQVCNRDGCFKYKAPHCGGFCMAHFNEVSGKRKEKGGTQKVIAPPSSEEKVSGKPKKRPLEEVVADAPKQSPEQIVPSSEVTPKRKKPKHSTYPDKKWSSAKRAKPQKSLYPHSKQNAYNHPTGHAVAHLPSEPAVEFGSGWTMRTLMRPNPDGRKPSDTYYYSPQMLFKFRSRIQVQRYLKCLKQCDGDEGKAIIEFKKVASDKREITKS